MVCSKVGQYLLEQDSAVMKRQVWGRITQASKIFESKYFFTFLFRRFLNKLKLDLTRTTKG